VIQVLSADDRVFGTFKKPSSSFYAIEKSMYRSISSRMLHLFASIKDFNNLIGEPVNKYRLNYKHMEKLREIFFRKVQNDIVDLQKYLDYYKWLDSAVTQMLDQLMPFSARYAENVRNVVESHSLERNKIKYQPPLLKVPGENTATPQNVIEGSPGGPATELGVPGAGSGTPIPPLQPRQPNPNLLPGVSFRINPETLIAVDPVIRQEEMRRFSNWIENFDPDRIFRDFP
jgi:hypothetical protein